ncbi:MAG: hypothetical protein NC433_04015 [Clostridiales bacterium]|nr:hypothetical protein [Clostridiales bacterium]
MKHETHFKKLMSTALALTLSVSVLMQGMSAMATEEPLDVELAGGAI